MIQCNHCTHSQAIYRNGLVLQCWRHSKEVDETPRKCADYEREPGADDDKGEDNESPEG